MDHNYIRNFLINKGITAYELSKETGFSISGMDYFINGDCKPRRKTLEKLNEFVEKLKEEESQDDKNTIFYFVLLLFSFFTILYTSGSW